MAGEGAAREAAGTIEADLEGNIARALLLLDADEWHSPGRARLSPSRDQILAARNEEKLRLRKSVALPSQTAHVSRR